jgi:hypothetical protein
MYWPLRSRTACVLIASACSPDPAIDQVVVIPRERLEHDLRDIRLRRVQDRLRVAAAQSWNWRQISTGRRTVLSASAIVVR